LQEHSDRRPVWERRLAEPPVGTDGVAHTRAHR
jgi:hypothetical protein